MKPAEAWIKFQRAAADANARGEHHAEAFARGVVYGLEMAYPGLRKLPGLPAQQADAVIDAKSETVSCSAVGDEVTRAVRMARRYLPDARM